MKNLLKNLLIAIFGVLLLGLGVLGGFHLSELREPQVIEKEIPVIKEVPKIVEVNHTIVKEVPKEVIKYINNTVIVDFSKELKEEVIEYLSDFEEIEGFDRHGFADEEITVYDFDDIKFVMVYGDETDENPEVLNISGVVEYKYKAEGLPREYHAYNFTCSYDNEEKEIKECVLNEI